MKSDVSVYQSGVSVCIFRCWI